MRRLAVCCFFLMVAVVSAWMPLDPAAASGGGNLAFHVTGTLPTFPCPQACGVGFWGIGTGTGHVASVDDGIVVDGTYTVSNGWVSGSARYLEADCASGGTADGTVTLSGPTTGVIVSTGGLPHRGSINWVVIDVEFRYERVGATAAILVRGGRVTVWYSFTTYSGTITQELLPSAGVGVFVVNAAEAAERCVFGAGPVEFSVGGDVSLLTA